MRILLFDDDVAAFPLSYDFPTGLEVHLHDRADRCLELVAGLRPDLVLMDFHMSSSYKGDQAVRDLRRVFTRDELPIIGISSADGLNARMLIEGANRVVPKRHLQELLWELAAVAATRR